MQKLSGICTTVALFGLMTVNVEAAIITLSPTSSTSIPVSGGVTFNMFVDGSDVGGILAGGLDLFYDIGVVSYNGDFAFDGAFPTDPMLSRLGDDCAAGIVAGCSGAGEINGIGFGNFSGLAAGGLTLVGSLSFTGVAAGLSMLTMADNDTPAGSWFNTAGDAITMNYSGEDVTVVPVPAAVWLFGSALFGLVGLTKKRAS